MENKVTFASGEITLEALYNNLSATQGAVITHPHPLYGGDMSNPVVESLATSFNRKNISTLRFNFRGVRGSEGSYDDGIGEQQDILAAVRFLVDQGITSIHIAGYSFGSWVLARIAELPAEVTALIFVSPPLALLPLDENLTLPLLQLVITGEDDEIAPVELVRASTPKWNPHARFEIIDFADHFYFGCFEALEQTMHRYLSDRCKKTL